MSKLTILLMTANSSDSPLALEEELRAIKEVMRRGKYRDSFEVQIAPAVRYSDLQGILLEHQPHVVHFSGHGNEDGQLMLVKDAGGESQAVSIEAIAKTFAILKDNIRLVVLNACFTETQARAIAKVIDCVVGTKREVEDTNAVEFASGFYEGLGYGRSVQTAFEMGRNRVQLSGSDQERVTKLFVRQGVDAAQLVLAAANSGDSAPGVAGQAAAATSAPAQASTGLPANLPVKLTGQQYRAFQNALVDAFTLDSLAQMVQYELDQKLSTITSPGDTGKVTFDLIGWAQRTGKLPDLIRGAFNEAPDNPELKKFLALLA